MRLRYLTWFMLIVGVWPSVAQTDYWLMLHRTRYDLALGQDLWAHLAITPTPPAGIFSYGFTFSLAGTNAVGNNPARITLPTELDHNGVLSGPALRQFQSGKATFKGTVDFYPDPLQPYTGFWLASLLLTNLAPGTYTLSGALATNLGS